MRINTLLGLVSPIILTVMTSCSKIKNAEDHNSVSHQFNDSILELTNDSLIIRENRKFDSLYKDYADALNRGDYEKSADFLPKQTFDRITRKEFVDYFKKSETQIGKAKIIAYQFSNYGSILRKGDSSFRKVNYQSTVIIKSIADTIDHRIFNHLKSVYGDGNVSYEEAKGIYTIKQLTDLLLMKGKGNWTFLEYRERKENKLIKRIIPKDVLAKLLGRKP